MALTHHIPLRSSMSMFQNMTKPISRGEKRRMALDNAKAQRIRDDLKAQRDARFRPNSLENKRVALIRRRPNNAEKKTVYNIVGLGDLVCTFAEAKEIARKNGKTHFKSGAIFAKL